MATTTPLVFINYRWCDSSAATGRIYDHLKVRLKHDRYFLTVMALMVATQ
jgi:hypothetical protein